MQLRRHWYVFATSAVVYICGCRFFENPASGNNPPPQTPPVSVTITPDAVPTEVAFCRITVTGDEMDEIGPVANDDCREITIEVPAGTSRKFHWERFTADSVLLDTGSATIDVTDGMDDVVIAIKIAIDPPVITVQPVDCNVTGDDTAVFSIAATGEFLKFQWLKGSDSVAAATSDTIAIPHPDRADSGTVWRCIVSNFAGSDTSDAATLTVVPAPDFIPDRDTVPPVITVPDSLVYVTIGKEYTDSGVWAEDDVDGDVTEHIITTGTVNVNEAGSYSLTYTVSDKAGNSAIASRNVIVEALPAADTIAPSIVLSGNATVMIPAGAVIDEFMKTWNDSGYTATDNRDGDITDNVKVSAIEPNDGTTWTITYSVTDSAGNAASPVKRFFILPLVPPVCTPIILLVGSDSMTLKITPAGTPRWQEPGFSANDSIDGDLTAKVSIDSSGLVANLSNPGTYQVTYSLTNSSGSSALKSRTVTVVSDNPYDTNPPVLTLLGRNPDTVLAKSAETYTDPGVTAFDDRDGNLTANVIKSGTVQMDRLGTYSITYIVTDSATNRAVASRKVTVVRDTTTTDRLVLYIVPSDQQLPSTQKTYLSFQVDGSGPDMSSIQKMSIAWDLTNRMLIDFELYYTGAPYVRSLASITQTFSSAQPSMTLTGTGAPGLDGKYYVAISGEEFIWVKTDGSFAIIWQE